MDIEEAKRRSQAGPRVLLARRMVLLLLTFASTVTVARLVSPREYGLAAMSAVVLTLVQVFRDFGLTNAVLRKGTISQAELSFIFWFNVAVTTALCVLLACAAPLLSRFYDEPVVLWTTLASLVGFLVGGATLQHRAIINRDLRFSALAVIDVAAQLGSFAVTLALAFVRHDVWALVAGGIAHALIASGLSVHLSGWRPGRPRRLEGVGDLLRFGANSSVFSISTLLSNNAAQIIVGYGLGSAPLGQYNRAQTLYTLPIQNLIQPITQSVMPLLTRLRVDPAQYRAAYLALVRRLCAFLMPLSLTLMCMAPPLTRALLGERWDMAGWILAALAPALVAVGVAGSISDVFVTQDRSADLRNLGLVELVVRLGAIFLGLPYGVVGVAAGFALSTILVVLLRVYVLGREGPVTARDQLRAGLPGVPPALGALAAAGTMLFAAPGLPDLLRAVAIGAAGVAGALAAGMAVRPSRVAIGELVEMFGGPALLARLRRLRR